MRRKIGREEGFSEGQVVESWSGKKIVAACIILLLVLGGGYYLFQQAKKKASQVLGSSVSRNVNSADVKLPTQEDAAKLLDKAKVELSNLTPDNLTASDAALQKIILDLQSLQKEKGNPIGVFCDLVCKKQ